MGAGNLSYVFNRSLHPRRRHHVLPSVRSTEGQFPYWLGVDDRLIADEFFRGSYTTGFWLKGEIVTNVQVHGHDRQQPEHPRRERGAARQHAEHRVPPGQWLPTTGEFGLYGTFGDFDYHEKVATRLGAHYTHSTEDKQSQPGTNGIENSQIRLTDGSVIFTPDLFGPGITVERVTYHMASVDGGAQVQGSSPSKASTTGVGLSNFTGTNTAGIADIDDHGFQVQSSAMVVPKSLQVYLSGSAIRGRYGNGSELRAGANWYFIKDRGLRLNAEWIHLNKCPVGYTAVPYPVGGNGDVFHVNVEMNF